MKFCARWLPCAAACASLACSAPVLAQQAPDPTVHWAYASFFGTGWYKLGDQQSAFIANLAPRWLSGKTGWLENDGRKPVYTLRVPITVGVTRLDLGDVPGILDPDNFATLSAGLAGDVDIPLTPRFSVRPNVQASYGTVLGESDDAWTYLADLRARYAFEAGKLDWGLVGSVGLVGYDTRHGDDDSFTYAALGAEFEYPVSWFGSAGGQSVLYWHVVYTDLLNRIEVQSRDNQFEEITNYWQAGVAFGKRDERIRLWFLSFDRLGFAYDISPSGQLRGVKFVFRSLYEP